MDLSQKKYSENTNSNRLVNTYIALILIILLTLCSCSHSSADNTKDKESLPASSDNSDMLGEEITPPAIIEPVLYYQFDDRWAKKKYNDGRNNDKVRGSACAPAIMAMVLATFVDENIDPGDAAKWSLDNGYFTPDPGRTKDEFFPAYGDVYGIKVTRLLDGDLRKMSADEALKYHEMATDAVKNGNWVIAFMGKGPWTTDAHFVLWYGLEGDEVLIRDSNSKKPEKARNKLSLFRETVIRYWEIDISQFR